jgi:hypothetical protein
VKDVETHAAQQQVSDPTSPAPSQNYQIGSAILDRAHDLFAWIALSGDRFGLVATAQQPLGGILCGQRRPSGSLRDLLEQDLREAQRGSNGSFEHRDDRDLHSVRIGDPLEQSSCDLSGRKPVRRE